MRYENINFSIICPLYNKEKYIKETIESVITQTYENWELIIVDDGCTDNSIRIVKKYLSDKIKLIHRSDVTTKNGASVCRNIGIMNSKGSNIMFLDADDVLSFSCLEKRNSYISKYPDYNFYIFDIVHFIDSIHNRKENKIIYNYKKLTYFLSSKSRLYFLRKFLKYDSQWSICNVIWKRETLSILNGFSENFHRLQDIELHTRALLDFSISFKFLKYKVKPDVYVRADQDRSNSIPPFETYIRVYSSIIEYIKQNYLLINELKKPQLLKYMNAYILLFEQFHIGYYEKVRENELQTYVLTKQEFYEKISFYTNNRNKKAVDVYSKLSRFKLLNKLRIPSIYVFFYKMFL